MKTLDNNDNTIEANKIAATNKFNNYNNLNPMFMTSKSKELIPTNYNPYEMSERLYSDNSYQTPINSYYTLSNETSPYPATNVYNINNPSNYYGQINSDYYDEYDDDDDNTALQLQEIYKTNKRLRGRGLARRESNYKSSNYKSSNSGSKSNIVNSLTGFGIGMAASTILNTISNYTSNNNKKRDLFVRQPINNDPYNAKAMGYGLLDLLKTIGTQAAISYFAPNYSIAINIIKGLVGNYIYTTTTTQDGKP